MQEITLRVSAKSVSQPCMHACGGRGRPFVHRTHARTQHCARHSHVSQHRRSTFTARDAVLSCAMRVSMLNWNLLPHPVLLHLASRISHPASRIPHPSRGAHSAAKGSSSTLGTGDDDDDTSQSAHPCPCGATQGSTTTRSLAGGRWQVAGR